MTPEQLEAIGSVKMVAVRDLPHGVVFCSHATRRALLKAYQSLVVDIRPIEVRSGGIGATLPTDSRDSRLSVEQAIAALTLVGAVLNRCDDVEVKVR